MSIVFMRRVLGVCAVTHGVTLPENVARRKANRANNERQCTRQQRRRPRSTAWVAVRVRGEETLSESRSSGADGEEGEDEEVGEIISSPRSPSPQKPPLTR
jgi:hypothetical protein